MLYAREIHRCKEAIGLPDETVVEGQSRKWTRQMGIAGRMDLNAAIEKGDMESIRLLIKAGANLNPSTADGSYPPLLEACLSRAPNRVEMVKLLLESGAEPNAKIGSNGLLHMIIDMIYLFPGNEADLAPIGALLLDHGLRLETRDSIRQTALIAACDNGYLDLVKVLIERGADIHATTGEELHESPLLAAMSGSGRRAGRPHRQIVKMLIEAGADPNTRHVSGWSVLHEAAQWGYLELVKLLVEKGADVNFFSRWCASTPLMEAAGKGHTEVVRFLADSGARIDSGDYRREEALSKASYHGHREVVSLLLARGANIHARDSRGNTPLLHAAWSGHTSVLELLLESGAEVNEKNDLDWNALMQACEQGHAETATFLVERGSEINPVEKEKGVTPLMLACGKESLEIVRLLLQDGADVDVKDHAGRTALDRVIDSMFLASASLEIVTCLLNAGASVTTRDARGNTPLCIASMLGYAELIELLVEKESDVNAADDLGVTPLMQAAMYGHGKAADWLLRHAPEVNARTRSGKTAFALATEEGHPEIAKSLADAKADSEIAAGRICAFEECPICQQLPDHAVADRNRGEEFPPAAARLIQRSRCPYCGTRYEFSNEYEWGVPSTDIDRLQRVR